MLLSQLHPNEGQIKGVPSNPRTITDEDFAKLKKSLRNFRKMLSLRPMVVDEDFNILGGNMRYQALCRLAEEKVKVGAFQFTDEIPDEWVKQDCTLTEKEKREFVIKDNQERGQNDWDKLVNEWSAEELKEWDCEAANWDELENVKNTYSRKIETPIYEPSGEDVELSECLDEEKYSKLIGEIEKADIEDEIKDFLRLAATRHIRFNYEKIADYYSKANKEVKRLFEDSVLVVIDFGKAIEDGYVKLSQQMIESYECEHGQL